MAREYDHLFKLLIIGDSGKYKHTEHHHTVRGDAQLKKSPSIVPFSSLSLSSVSSSLFFSPLFNKFRSGKCKKLKRKMTGRAVFM